VKSIIPCCGIKNSLPGEKISLRDAKKFPAAVTQTASKSWESNRLPAWREKFPCRQGICLMGCAASGN
jgi:hypothetical protein